jgi:hypothetical protein
MQRQEASHLSTLIQRVRDDETVFSYAKKEHLINVAEYILSWPGKYCEKEYSEAIRVLAHYRLAKLANRHPKFRQQSWKLIAKELDKKYIGRCRRCGLVLTNPISLEAGHGPVCRRKLGISGEKPELRQMKRGVWCDAG